MKEISEYRKSATIYLVPNLRNGNSLKIEFGGLFDIDVFKSVLKRLRSLGFSCSEAVSHNNLIGQPNIIDIALDLCVDEREIAEDLFNYLGTLFGKDQVIDRIRSTIRRESNKMKT
jgi:hypothetical protein